MKEYASSRERPKRLVRNDIIRTAAWRISSSRSAPHPCVYQCVAVGRVGGDEGAGRVVLRRQVIVERERRLRETARLVYAIDRDALLAHLGVEVAPPRPDVGPVREAWPHREDPYLEGVARTSALDGDGPRHHVHAGPALGWGNTRIDGAHAVVHEEVRCVPGLMGERLDVHDVAGAHG